VKTHLLILTMLVSPATAHEWYDAWCCGDRDCVVVNGLKVVHVGPQEYDVWLYPGQHPYGPKQGLIVYEFHGEPKLSPDGQNHVCIARSDVGRVRCLYLGSMG
jgi:hypothetical protein